MLSGETPTKSPVLLRTARGKSPPAARVERSAHIYMLQSNTTAANRDSGSSRQTATARGRRTRRSNNAVDGSSKRLFVLRVFYKSAKQSRESHASTPTKITNSYVFNMNWLIEQRANLSQVVVPVCCWIMLPIEICYLVVLRMRNTARIEAVYLCSKHFKW